MICHSFDLHSPMVRGVEPLFVYMLTICVSFFVCLLCHVACRVLVPCPGIESMLPAVQVQRPNQWATRKFPCVSFLMK